MTAHSVDWDWEFELPGWVRALLNAAHANGVADTVARLHAARARGVEFDDGLLSAFDGFARDAIAQLDPVHRQASFDRYVDELRRLTDNARDVPDDVDPVLDDPGG